MTKVKICGITNVRDARQATDLGADALGFNFYAESPRYVSPETVNKIILSLPAKTQKVGVFVNESIESVLSIAASSGIDTIQLHGDESAVFVSDLRKETNCKIIRAIRVTVEFDVADLLKFSADGFLLDAYSRAAYGGTGESFDWEIAKNAARMINRLYLAGGLTSETVAEAVLLVRPYAVDVASGVEWSPGIKDPQMMKAFISNAKNA